MRNYLSYEGGPKGMILRSSSCVRTYAVPCRELVTHAVVRCLYSPADTSTRWEYKGYVS